MTEARSYPSGVPCWVDTEQPDPGAAQRFYGPLFRWTFDEASSESFVIARLDGRDAAAIVAGSGPPVWSTYIAVNDIDDVADRIVRAGGGVVRSAEDADSDGRTAWVSDPTGAAFRLWLPRRRLGAQVVNVPGAWNFSDLHTFDPVTANAFYGDVFGWEADDVDGGGAMWRRPGYGDHLAATVDPERSTSVRRQSPPLPASPTPSRGWLRSTTPTSPTGTSRSPWPTVTRPWPTP
jgi:uncharacterized protein